MLRVRPCCRPSSSPPSPPSQHCSPRVIAQDTSDWRQVGPNRYDQLQVSLQSSGLNSGGLERTRRVVHCPPTGHQNGCSLVHALSPGLQTLETPSRLGSNQATNRIIL